MSSTLPHLSIQNPAGFIIDIIERTVSNPTAEPFDVAQQKIENIVKKVLPKDREALKINIRNYHDKLKTEHELVKHQNDLEKDVSFRIKLRTATIAVAKIAQLEADEALSAYQTQAKQLKDIEKTLSRLNIFFSTCKRKV